MKQYGQAAMMQMVIDKLPDMAKAVSEPLSKTDKIIVCFVFCALCLKRLTLLKILYSIFESKIPSLHITNISSFWISLSYVVKLILFNIPAGKLSDFIIWTFFLFFTYVGQAPFFINSIFPLYKSIIAISNVANISSFAFIIDLFERKMHSDYRD